MRLVMNKPVTNLIFALKYDDLYAGVKAYKACKKTYKALHRLFTDEELNTLYEEVSDC